MARSGTSTPKDFLSCETTRVAASECPPSAKKSLLTLRRSRPSTCAQAAAIISSAGVRGATNSSSGSTPTGVAAGSNARSTLPFALSGRASSTAKAAGTM
jgi:hypothetical protein